MWTERFLRIAAEVASWSKDPSTKVGAVLVGPENTPISWGYNGFARGDDDSDHFYLDKVHKHTKVLHAEENALLNALRSSAKTVGATIYITHPPCLHCVGRIKQAGIVRAVFREPDEEFLTRWNYEGSLKLMARLGIDTFCQPVDSPVARSSAAEYAPICAGSGCASCPADCAPC